ncbi:hypothetical protein BDZ45DRAFT_798217 [Acephala macrosclerotiorum]|nr:hypothetical protein BDZ45DRAFT_798217 [Acephala macrosclerotiorum]
MDLMFNFDLGILFIRKFEFKKHLNFHPSCDTADPRRSIIRNNFTVRTAMSMPLNPVPTIGNPKNSTWPVSDAENDS